MGASTILRISVPAPDGSLQLTVELFAPAQASSSGFLLVCLPGGGMNRHFYDLQAADGDDSFSFARQMSALGHWVALIDPPGLGDSQGPADAWGLSAERLADIHAALVDRLLAGLHSGGLLDSLPALPGLRSVGVGHSMGGLLTVVQQARHPRHAAIVVLGFGTGGLPQYLPPAAAALGDDPAAISAELPRLAQAMFGKAAWPRLPTGGGGGGLYGGRSADPRAVAALSPALDALLPLPALLAMFAGNVAAEAAQIQVPVFIGVGDRDMTGAAHQRPADFSGSQDLSLCILPSTGHSHFLFPGRLRLYRRLHAWLAGLEEALTADER